MPQNFSDAASKFASFRQTYPQSPLEPASIIGEGRSLEGLGDTREAARRYLRRVEPDLPETGPAPDQALRSVREG